MKVHRLNKGFTLVEILVVVVIIGLLAGIAIYKVQDSRERAETNYLKSMINMVDSGMERVIVTEGRFPDIMSTAPDERLTEILLVLQDRNLFVWMEGTYGKQWTDAYKAVGAPLLAANTESVGIQAIIDTNRKARNGLATGNPKAKEILILPVAGPIIYPERAVLVLNDPNSPNAIYHYATYWLPKEVAAAVERFKNGGFASEAERNLVMNNLALANLTEDELKGLLSITQNSVEHTLAANQLAAIIRGEVDGGNITKEEATKLLEQMLHNPNYDPSTLNLAGLDLSKFDDLSLLRIARNEKLDSDQVDFLVSKLVASSGTTKQDLIKGLLQNAGLTGTRFDSVAAAIGGDIANLRTSGTWLYELSQSSLSADERLLRGKLLADEFQKSLQSTYTFASAASSQDYNSYTSLLKNTGVWNNLSSEDRQAVALEAIQKTVNSSQNNLVMQALQDGSLVATKALVDASLDKFLTSNQGNTSGSMFGQILAHGGAELSEPEKQSVRDWFGGADNFNPYAVSYHSYLFASPDLFPTAESLEPAIRNGIYYSQALNGQSATDALKNPNISQDQISRILDKVISNPGDYLASDLNRDAAALAALNSKASEAEKTRLLTAALASPSGNLAFVGELEFSAADQQRAFDYLVGSTSNNALVNRLASAGQFSSEQLTQLVSSAGSSAVTQGILNSVLTNSGSRSNSTSPEESLALLNAALNNEGLKTQVLNTLVSGSNYKPEVLIELQSAIVANIETIGTTSNYINSNLLNSMNSNQKEAVANYYAENGYTSNALKNSGVSWMPEAQYDTYASYVLDTIAVNNPDSLASYTFKSNNSEAVTNKALALAVNTQTNPAILSSVGSLVATSSPSTYAQNAGAILQNTVSNMDSYSAGVSIGSSLQALASTVNAQDRAEITSKLTAQLAGLVQSGGFADFTYGISDVGYGNVILGDAVLALHKQNLITTEASSWLLAESSYFDQLSLADKTYIKNNVLNH